MSTVYFFRHGQAGLRDDYDRLSALGHEQAALLGAHAVEEGWQFDLALVGGLRRQRETAAAVLDRLRVAGLPPRQVEQDELWNEFDLDVVYAGLGPQLAAADAQFRAEFEQIAAEARSADAPIHRRWVPADTKIIEAWIAGRHEFEGESWRAFVERIHRAGSRFAALPEDARVAVFTSATPVAIWVNAAFGSNHPGNVMKLAGAAINSNITVLRWRGGQPHLAMFNAVPHLREARLRTFR